MEISNASDATDAFFSPTATDVSDQPHGNSSNKRKFLSGLADQHAPNLQGGKSNASRTNSAGGSARSRRTRSGGKPLSGSARCEACPTKRNVLAAPSRSATHSPVSRPAFRSSVPGFTNPHSRLNARSSQEPSASKPTPRSSRGGPSRDQFDTENTPHQVSE